MEGVGARLGRSSTRYGPVTVFSGPVRKWKKRWVHVSASAPPSTNPNNAKNVPPHLLLYKWTPLSQSNPSDDAAALPEEPQKRKFRYVPVYVIEEEKKGDVEIIEDDTNPSDAATTLPSPAVETTEESGEKPAVNDVPMEASEGSFNCQAERQDLNETSLDLNLG